MADQNVSRETPNLLDGLDRAAKTLLDSAFPATNESREPAPVDGTTGLGDKIKAFTAVCDWMSARTKLIPEDRKSGKGEQLRSRFHGTKASSRRSRGATEEGNEPPGSTDSGPAPNGSDTAAH